MEIYFENNLHIIWWNLRLIINLFSMSFTSSKICKLWKNDVFFYCKILSFINILFFFLQMTRSFDCLIPPMFKLTNLVFRECPHINMVCSTETQDHILTIDGYIFWLHILDAVNTAWSINQLIKLSILYLTISKLKND